MCQTGKIAYPNPQKAHSALRGLVKAKRHHRLRHRQVDGHQVLTVFKCRRCHGWHIGNG